MSTAIKFKNRRLFYIDQTKLPLKEIYKECKSLNDGYWAIKKLRVRGAPLIGVFAAYCVYIAIKDFKGNNKDIFLGNLKKIISFLKSCRPTAVNLSWALERIRGVVYNNRDKTVRYLKDLVLKEAQSIHKEDVGLCSKMAKMGVKLIKEGDKILTHCNTGWLATSGQGTALGVIYEACSCPIK